MILEQISPIDDIVAIHPHLFLTIRKASGVSPIIESPKPPTDVSSVIRNMKHMPRHWEPDEGKFL